MMFRVLSVSLQLLTLGFMMHGLSLDNVLTFETPLGVVLRARVDVHAHGHDAPLPRNPIQHPPDFLLDPPFAVGDIAMRLPRDDWPRQGSTS